MANRFLKTVGVASLVAGLALTTMFAAPASAATQEELESRIQTLERALADLKGELTQVKVEAKEEKGLPSWAERITPFGDVRFRYENTRYDDFKGKDKDGKDRFRVRLRFGVKSQIHEDVELGFRMASGSDDDPTSTNQTLGNYWSEIGNWGVDQVYVKWTPGFMPDKMMDLTFGKAKNPFVTSKAVWDGDVVPEGAYLKFTFNKKGNIQPFILGTALTVEQDGEFSDNFWTFAGQAGVDGKFGAFSFTTAVGYTNWDKFGEAGFVPPNTHGNVVNENAAGDEYLSNFEVLDLYGKAAFKFAEKGSTGVWGHYINNTDASGAYSDQDTAWGAGVFVGWKPVKFNLWYKHVEANATPGFISDSDSGFVNTECFVAGVEWKVWKYGALSVNYFDGKNIEDAIGTYPFKTVLVDFVFKF